MKVIKTKILIVGAGVAGLSTAYFLGKKNMKDVIILEQEKKLGGHASGRNAGMLRQAVSDPILVRLAKASRKYYEQISKNGWVGFKIQKNGSLLLCDHKDKSKLAEISSALKKNNVSAQLMNHVQAGKKVELLKDANFEQAIFCPTDAMVDIEALLSGFVKELRRMQIKIHYGVEFKSIRSEDGRYIVLTQGGKQYSAEKIVNSAGAWAQDLAMMAGASNLPIESYRRHLFLSAKSKSKSQNSYDGLPFIWDISKDFYFRPVDKGLLLSACDKTLELTGDRRERTNPKIKKLLLGKMKEFSKKMLTISIDKPQSGLRTMTKDGRFVIGEDAKKKNFYWVAALGGHGVTTCFSVGELAANIILGKKVDSEIKEALSPGRFF